MKAWVRIDNPDAPSQKGDVFAVGGFSPPSLDQGPIPKTSWRMVSRVSQACRDMEGMICVISGYDPNPLQYIRIHEGYEEACLWRWMVIPKGYKVPPVKKRKLPLNRNFSKPLPLP